MKKVKISVGFSKYTDATALVKAKHISLSMTGNTNYPTPSPSLAVYNTAITTYENALGNVQNGSITDTSIKDAARANLETLMQALGMYVQLNCGNDLTKAQSSGFDVHANPVAASIPQIPINVRGDWGAHTGEIVVSCDANADADFYCCRYSLSTTAPIWITLMAQKSRKFTLTGLAHGKDILVSLCALNSAGNSDWSDAVTVLVN